MDFTLGLDDVLMLVMGIVGIGLVVYYLRKIYRRVKYISRILRNKNSKPKDEINKMANKLINWDKMDNIEKGANLPFFKFKGKYRG